MRTKINIYMLLAFAFMFLTSMVSMPTLADASTAQGTVIRNQATITYNDAGGTLQPAVVRFADVTVTLLQAAPNVTVNTVTATTINQGATTTINYYVTATSNGPENYTFGSGTANVTNMNPAGAGAAAVPASVTGLGATTLAAAAGIGATTIKVPYNPSDPAGSVNGIAPGDTIVIAGRPYVVQAAGIDKTNATVWGDPDYNMVTITLTTPIAVTAGVAGQVVGERTTFSVTYASGTVDTGFTSGTFNANGTATSGLPSPATGTSANTLITVNKPALTVSKTVSVDNGASFAATGNAAPLASLIYKITITNSGAGDATSVKIVDALPPYLSYVPGQSKYATSSATAYAAANALVEGVGPLGLIFAGNTVTYNPGSPGTGTVSPAGELVLFYRCTVN